MSNYLKYAKENILFCLITMQHGMVIIFGKWTFLVGKSLCFEGGLKSKVMRSGHVDRANDKPQ